MCCQTERLGCPQPHLALEQVVTACACWKSERRLARLPPCASLPHHCIATSQICKGNRASVSCHTCLSACVSMQQSIMTHEKAASLNLLARHPKLQSRDLAHSCNAAGDATCGQMLYKADGNTPSCQKRLDKHGSLRAWSAPA